MEQIAGILTAIILVVGMIWAIPVLFCCLAVVDYLPGKEGSRLNAFSRILMVIFAPLIAICCFVYYTAKFLWNVFAYLLVYVLWLVGILQHKPCPGDFNLE